MIAYFSLRHSGTVHLLQLSKSAISASVDNITSRWRDNHLTPRARLVVSTCGCIITKAS